MINNFFQKREFQLAEVDYSTIMYPAHLHIPSTRDVSSESSVAFLRPGGSESPIVSSLCLRTWPPFLDLALCR